MKEVVWWVGKTVWNSASAQFIRSASEKVIGLFGDDDKSPEEHTHTDTCTCKDK